MLGVAMPHKPENKICQLLSRDENEQIFNLLGCRCQSLATCVIQLYTTQGPLHSQWIKKETGILCFIKDNFRKNYFFRLYCLKKGGMVWEQEMYNNMEYIASCPFLHTFEGEDCMIAFNFANEGEAADLKDTVDEKLRAKRKKEERKKIMHNNERSFTLPATSDPKMYKKYSDPAETKAKRRRNLTKADIGNPSEFRHISHVGWDPDKGFDINCDDPDMRIFFNKAGVSEKQLQDKETRDFIYDFIAKNGGREAVVQEQVQKTTTRKPAPAPPSPGGGPPVPPRGAGRSTISHSRAAPPPPPTPNLQPPRPPPTPRTVPQANSIPPPPVPAVPVPPPPPPMDIPAPPPLILQSEPVAPPAPDMRTALMESIRSGANLKPVEPEKKPVVEDARGDLMSEIRRGAFQLKPANEREVKPVTPPTERPGGDLASALARALADRNRVIHSEDDDTSDTDSNDDDWDA